MVSKKNCCYWTYNIDNGYADKPHIQGIWLHFQSQERNVIVGFDWTNVNKNTNRTSKWQDNILNTLELKKNLHPGIHYLE